MTTLDDLIANTKLPIVQLLGELRLHLFELDHAVVQAEPGAGKTTIIPLALLQESWLKGRKIIVLEPRRMAAKAAAQRMAALLKEKVGERVGYRVRQDTRVSAITQIEVVTEGVLTRMLQSDPVLAGVALLVFDEFHERSLDGDLALALALQSRELYRELDPLKILVMSATLDDQRVSTLLDDAPVITSQGRSFPVSASYHGRQRVGEPFIEPLIEVIKSELKTNSTTSLLVFLPGQGEIRRVEHRLNEELLALDVNLAENIVVAPLYGNLSLAEQQRAIEPVSKGQRKVVLATNVAETSLTIEGIDTVVDSGLVRESIFDPGTGMSRLQTRRISAASSIQRMGRAGRLGPGRCLRMWSEEQQQQLRAHSVPEIVQADLAPLVLLLLAWGVDEPSDLKWLDPPPSGPFQQALDLLVGLGAVETTAMGVRQLSKHGTQLVNMPMHPRLAHMVVVGAQRGMLKLACDFASLMSDRNPSTSHGADISYSLELVDGSLACPASLRRWCKRVQQQSRDYLKLVENMGIERCQVDKQDRENELAILVASAFPDRIASRQGHGSYRLSNGRRARLDPADSLAGRDWLAVAELGGQEGSSEDRIYAAVGLNEQLFEHDLKHLLGEVERVEWDESADKFVAEHRYVVGKLVVSAAKIDQIPEQQRVEALMLLIRKRGLSVLPWSEQLRQWQARVELVRGLGEAQHKLWPNVSDRYLLQTMESWLAPFLTNIVKFEQIGKIDLATVLSSMLSWELSQQLDKLAPRTFRVPSGSEITIDYGHNPPVLAVKMQEMFGCEHTPAIVAGKVSLMVHLLSPARRPLQITQDLAGFWRGSYQQVKKEMKGRYPKHPWPDDPLQALATRHTNKRSPK